MWRKAIKCCMGSTGWRSLASTGGSRWEWLTFANRSCVGWLGIREGFPSCPSARMHTWLSLSMFLSCLLCGARHPHLSASRICALWISVCSHHWVPQWRGFCALHVFCLLCILSGLIHGRVDLVTLKSLKWLLRCKFFGKTWLLSPLR